MNLEPCTSMYGSRWHIGSHYCYHFLRRRVICDEIALESGILKSSIHCFNWGVAKKRKVTACFMTVQDLTSHELFGLFLLITGGKHCLTLLIILTSISSQSWKNCCMASDVSVYKLHVGVTWYIRQCNSSGQLKGTEITRALGNCL
jgi:hypothetical protein